MCTPETKTTEGTPVAVPQLFDEPDDELEEFEEIGQSEIVADADDLQWEEEWDISGWDDEDADENFVSRLEEELERYKKAHQQSTKPDTQTAAAPPKQ